MSSIAKLEMLLARVQKNRRPKPPDLAEILIGRSVTHAAASVVGARVGGVPVTSAPAAAAPIPEAPAAAARPSAAPPSVRQVAAFASPVPTSERPAPKPTAAEAITSRAPDATPQSASRPSEPEIEIVMDAESGEVEISGELTASVEVVRDGGTPAAAPAVEERTMSESRERPAHPTHERTAAVSSPTSIEPLPASPSGPVVRVVRPFEVAPPTFGALLRRTLALRPA
jgi:hypothetical protein